MLDRACRQARSAHRRSSKTTLYCPCPSAGDSERVDVLPVITQLIKGTARVSPSVSLAVVTPLPYLLSTVPPVSTPTRRKN